MDRFTKDDHKLVSEEASSSGTRILEADSRTASDLANQPEAVRSDKVMHPCIQPKLVTNASLTNDGLNNSKTLEKSDSSKTHAEEKKALKDSNDGASTTQRNVGAINSLIGITYQQKLSIPMVCQVAKKIREDKQLNFTITNDDEEGGLFDDIVFKSNEGDLFIQAKHKEDESYTITWDDLTSTDKGAPFAISKYLNSFLEKEWDKPPVLVLCTNSGLHEDIKTLVTEYPFGTNIVDSILKSITNDAYTIDLNTLKEETKNELLQYFKENSESSTLAKVIAESIIQHKPVEFRNESVQTKYRFIIENKIASDKKIKNDCYKVNKEYFHANEEFKSLFENEYKLKQTETLIWDDIKKKGIKLEKAQPTEFADKNKKRIRNSDLADFATQLAQHIFRETDVDFQIPVFQTYRYVIEKCIATDNKNRPGCYVVNEQTFKKPEFKDLKRLFDNEYENLLKPKPKLLDIWKDIESKGIRLRKEKQPDKSGKKELPKHAEDSQNQLPKQIEDDQINKFFKSFMIVCNTKHEEDQVVASILEGEVLPKDIREQSSAAFTFNKVGMWILERMKDKSRTPIKRRDMEELFMDIESSLNFSQFKTFSNSNCNRLLNLGLQCKQEALQQFKLYKNIHSLLAKVKTNGNEECNVDIDRYNYPSWVVPQIIQSIDSKLDFLFLEDAQFEPRKKQIMDGFRALKSSVILVIECSSTSNVEGYIEARVEGMSTKTFKKIILIDQTLNASDIERDLLFSDLTDESKKKVFNQAEFISFFGTETSTGELIHDEDKLNFVLDVRQLTSGTAIKFNKLKESYQKIKDMFIHRKWEQCDKEKLPETSSRSFWSGREEGTTLTKLFPGSAGDNKISFKTFLDYNDLDIEEFNNILLHRNSAYTSALGIDENTKVHVIFNEAGSGKSFYLTWLASNLQDVRPSWWIIKFNLNEYSMEFDQLQKNDESETMDELIAIRFLFQLVYLAFHVKNRLLVASNEKSSNAQTIAETLVFSNGCLKLDENKMKTLSSDELVLLRMFEHKFNSKQIVILMDGFDEIAPYYKTVVLKLLTTLITFDGISKVFLSSRPYGLRNEIETILKRCACYRLVKFNRKDQYEFIHRYLLKHFDGYKLSEERKQARTCRVVFAILSKMLKDLMEIPLFLSMGVELFMPMVKNYINLEEETVLKQIIKGCENSFETLSMVENFVAKKLNIVNIEKTGATDAIAKTAEALNYAEQKLEKVKETHSLLALYTIMDKKDVKKLLTNEQQNAALRYMGNVRNGSEKSGLIEGVARNRPIFNHMLFAEHFAALWFYANQNVTGVKDFLKRKVYRFGERKEMRKFLERMICKNSPLHMAVLDGSKLKMENILTKEPHSINARDEWGRIPLQLAFSSHFYRSWNEDGQDIIEFLLDRVDEVNVNLKDTYFEWFTLDYAYCADIMTKRYLLGKTIFDEYYYALTLLNKGASIDTPVMLSRVSEREHFDNLLLIESCSGRKCTSNFETFFTKVVQVWGPKQVLNLMFLKYDLFNINMEAIRALFELYGDSIPILEFCIIIDSLMFKILMENSNDPKHEHANEHHLRLAFQFRSINVLQYLIVDRQQYLDLSAIKDNFEQELCVLLVYMQCDEQKFKSLFHDYCSRYNIACLEETSLDKSKNWNRRFSSQTEHFPTKFEIRNDPRIDSGTEFLISRALQLDNESAVEYLLYKTKTNPVNRFIRQIILNCKNEWCCLSSYHFLLDDSKRSSSTDLKSTDENGRNLLHFAVRYGDLNLVKCLINHYGFKPSEMNEKEQNWNAFFYCVQGSGNASNKLKIFTYLMEKDPFDCFGQLDSRERSVFYYAKINEKSIGKEIFKRECKLQEHLPIEERIPVLMGKLQKSGISIERIWKYLEANHLMNEKSVKIFCDYLKTTGELNYKNEERGRNLLHIACMEGWLTLTKCLIEHYGFDAKEINEKDYNRNAFFCCAWGLGNASNRLKVFTYLMAKDPFDCFGQVDSREHNVFYYALFNNVLVAEYIILTDLPTNYSASVKEWASTFSKRFSESNLTGEEIDNFLMDWKQQSSLEAKDEIYLEIRSNLERINRTTE